VPSRPPARLDPKESLKNSARGQFNSYETSRNGRRSRNVNQRTPSRQFKTGTVCARSLRFRREVFALALTLLARVVFARRSDLSRIVRVC
jgi:hypothetical protein